MRHLATFATVILFALPAAAAPPREMLTTEDRIVAGCRHASLVFVGQALSLRTVPRAGGETQTADVRLLELIKGTANMVPHTLTNLKNIPKLTDTLGVDLEDRMTYLIIMDTPAAPGAEWKIPEMSYDWNQNRYTNVAFHQAVLVAKRACRQ
jgi:hypothetical protein